MKVNLVYIEMLPLITYFPDRFATGVNVVIIADKRLV